MCVSQKQANPKEPLLTRTSWVTMVLVINDALIWVALICSLSACFGSIYTKIGTICTLIRLNEIQAVQSIILISLQLWTTSSSVDDYVFLEKGKHAFKLSSATMTI